MIDDAVAYKNALIDEGGSASRINAKLSFLRDLFAYALANGLRAEASPFENVKVSSKSKLEQQKRSYKPFSADDIATIFDPTAYPARMDKPAYRWFPFLALYSGARLGLPACRCRKSSARATFGSSTSRRRRTRTPSGASPCIAS
nr:hypothetical protein [Burkholderia pseudomallei]